MNVATNPDKFNPPVIAGVEITTDAEGRFNLNALHKASGLGANKAPAQWLRTQQAKDLISELEMETMQICTVSVPGRNGGTFVHELLAVSFAGWISPKYQLKVNQTFIDWRAGKLEPKREVTRSELAQMVLDAENERQALEIKAIEQKCVINNLLPKAEAHDRFINATGDVNLRTAMREIGVKPNLAIGYMRKRGSFFKEGLNNCTPKADLVGRGYFKVYPSAPDRNGNTYPQTFVTPRGVSWLDSIMPDDLRIGGEA